MTPETVMTHAREALGLALMIAGPMLVTALLVGVTIGLIQAATQVNEMTVAFVPKLLAMGAALVIAGPWMLRMLVQYTENLFRSIPSLVS